MGDIDVTRIDGEAAGRIDVKRFHLPGIKTKSTCEHCGVESIKDMDVEYLSYPVINRPFDLGFYCGYCDHEWAERVRLRISLELAK